MIHRHKGFAIIDGRYLGEIYQLWYISPLIAPRIDTTEKGYRTISDAKKAIDGAIRAERDGEPVQPATPEGV